MPDEINLNDLNSREDYKDRIRKRIGRNIRKYRKACNLNQDQLAELLGCTCGQISFMERGERNPQLYFLYQIAYILGVSIGDLLSIGHGPQSYLEDEGINLSDNFSNNSQEDDTIRAKKDVLYNLISTCENPDILDHLIASLKLFSIKSNNDDTNY